MCFISLVWCCYNGLLRLMLLGKLLYRYIVGMNFCSSLIMLGLFLLLCNWLWLFWLVIVN